MVTVDRFLQWGLKIFGSTPHHLITDDVLDLLEQEAVLDAAAVSGDAANIEHTG